MTIAPSRSLIVCRPRSDWRLLLVFLALMGLSACAPEGSPSGGPGPTLQPGELACPDGEPPPLAATLAPRVTIATTMGVVEVDVDAAEAPIAAANFVALAACGFYDGLVFHRIVPGFIIQGGDPTGTGKGGAGYGITDEPQRGIYERGVVALSRTAAANSQSSQFFIVLSDEAGRALSVTNNYAIVGRVISGMDVVDAIAAGPNGGPPLHKAGDPVVMLTVTVDRVARLSLAP